MLPALGAGKTVVDCSTIDPEVERAQHERVARHRRRATSTRRSRAARPGAEKGTLTLMVGGDAGHAGRRPARRSSPSPGSSSTSAGPGMGQVVKLCNQLIYAAQMTATAEATAMAVTSGVDMDKLLRGAHPRHRRLRGGADPPAGARRGPREPGVERLAARLHDRPHGQGPRPGPGLRGPAPACPCPRRRRPASCSPRPARPATGGRTSRPWPRWSWRCPAPDDRARGRCPRPALILAADHRARAVLTTENWAEFFGRAGPGPARLRRDPGHGPAAGRPGRGGPPHGAAPHLPLDQPDRPGRLRLRARRPPGGQRGRAAADGWTASST